MHPIICRTDILDISMNCFRMLEEIEGPRCSEKKAKEEARDRAQQLFSDLDRDGDGCISMEEFVEGYIRYFCCYCHKTG
jgi:hypothetical protein